MKEKTGLFSKLWWQAALVRAVRTAAQAALAIIGTSAVLMPEVQWDVVLSATALAFIISMLTSLAGLPEVEQKAELVQKEELINALQTENLQMLQKMQDWEAERVQLLEMQHRDERVPDPEPIVQ